MEQWSEIRRRVLQEGVSKRQILRETGLQLTLEKILSHSAPPGYGMQALRERPKLGRLLAPVRLLQQERGRTSSVFVLAWRPRNPRWAVDVTRRATGLNWRWHQFRCTFACKWLNRDGNKEALRLILGHKSISTTERYGSGSDDLVFAEARRL